jgi:hypothetical protein
MLQPTLLTPARALLTGLIDYAGLFPPASLGLGEAVAEFRGARASPDGWILHRFLCPASRLTDLAGLLAASMERGEASWSIGLIVDGPLGPAIATGQDFAAEMSPAASISAVEARLSVVATDDPSQAVSRVVDAAATLGEETRSYLEIPFGDGAEAAVGAIAAARARGSLAHAKIRCGGVIPEAVPSVESLADVLVLLAAHSLPMKATAGLHHPVRTHDADLGVEVHGFVNLAFANELARAGAHREDIVRVLLERDPAAFHFGAASLTWGERVLSARQLQTARSEGLHGFGSCSIAEPVEDLVAIGVPGVDG